MVETSAGLKVGRFKGDHARSGPFAHFFFDTKENKTGVVFQGSHRDYVFMCLGWLSIRKDACPLTGNGKVADVLLSQLDPFPAFTKLQKVPHAQISNPIERLR